MNTDQDRVHLAELEIRLREAEEHRLTVELRIAKLEERIEALKRRVAAA